MRYLRLKSLTWWSGFSAVALGVAMLVLPNHPALGQLNELMGLLTNQGASSPAQMIFFGLGLIGLRDKLERAVQNGTK
jgi:hypothetical protein